MKKLNLFYIHGKFAKPSYVKSNDGTDIELTKELLQNSVNDLRKPIKLNDSHTASDGGVLYNISYDEDQDAILYEGIVYDDQFQKNIMAGKNKISPEFWSIGDVTNPERVYITGAALTDNPAIPGTTVEGRWMFMEGEKVEVEPKVKEETEKKPENDLIGEYAKQHLKEKLTNDEQKIETLSAKLKELESKTSEVLKEKDMIYQKYSERIKSDIAAVENELKSIGFDKPNEFAADVDVETRLKLLTEIKNKMATSDPATKPMSDKPDAHNQANDMLEQKKAKARAMGFSEEQVSKLR